MTTSASVFTVVVQASSMLLAGCPTALFKSQSDGFTVVATTGDVAPGVSLDDVTVKVPIVVDRHLWGVLGSLPSDDVTPADAYAQLVPMASMAAAAIGAAEEQAALRRVVDLKGSGVDGFELFAAVVAEAAALVRSSVTLLRFDANDEITVVAAAAPPVTETSRTLLGDASTVAPGRSQGLEDTDRSTVSVSITVHGDRWGSLVATAIDGPLGESAESQLAQFSGLIAAAIATIRPREHLQRLADEQQALLTVAGLVAGGQAPETISPLWPNKHRVCWNGSRSPSPGSTANPIRWWRRLPWGQPSGVSESGLNPTRCRIGSARPLSRIEWTTTDLKVMPRWPSGSAWWRRSQYPLLCPRRSGGC